MNLTDIEFVPECLLAAPTVLHRVQRLRSRPGTVSVGALRVPPRGLLTSRFDLPDDEVGYFAETPETAVYEVLARRELLSVTVDAIAKRALLTVHTKRTIRLLDVRPHATAWPVLQSLRYGVTQALAQDARDEGYEGIVYRSAQQYGADCYALFGMAMAAVAATAKAALLQPETGALHRAVSTAIRGSAISVQP